MTYVLVMLIWYYGASTPTETVYSRFTGPDAEGTCALVLKSLEVDTTFGTSAELFCINGKYYPKE